MQVQKIADLRKQRAVAFDAFKALGEKEVLSTEEQTQFTAHQGAIRAFDDQIKRAQAVQEAAAASAQPSPRLLGGLARIVTSRSTTTSGT